MGLYVSYLSVIYQLKLLLQDFKFRFWRPNYNQLTSHLKSGFFLAASPKEYLVYFTLSHVESDSVTGGMRRSTRVVTRVYLQCLLDHQGGHGGVGRRDPELVLPLLTTAHLTRGHLDPGQEVDHGVVVVPGI